MMNEKNSTYYEAVEKHDLDHVYGVGDWYDEASNFSDSRYYKAIVIKIPKSTFSFLK